MFETVVDAVAAHDPSRLDRTYENLGAAIGQLSPDVMLGLLEPTSTPKDKGAAARTPSTQTPKR